MSVTQRLFAASAALAALVALPAAPALAGTVVASSGPSAAQFRVGMQIADTQRITLRDGDSLTVLDGAGTRILRGPGTFTLAQASARANTRAFAALTTQRSATRARTGAVRAAREGETARNPSLWYVDVAQGGTICVRDPAGIRLWRADTSAAATYTIAPQDDPDARIAVTFGEREMLARWAGELPPADGATYLVAGEAAPTPVAITFVLLDQHPGEPEALARSLIERGCTVQVAQLAQALSGG